MYIDKEIVWNSNLLDSCVVVGLKSTMGIVDNPIEL